MSAPVYASIPVGGPVGPGPRETRSRSRELADQLARIPMLERALAEVLRAALADGDELESALTRIRSIAAGTDPRRLDEVVRIADHVIEKTPVHGTSDRRANIARIIEVARRALAPPPPPPPPTRPDGTERVAAQDIIGLAGHGQPASYQDIHEAVREARAADPNRAEPSGYRPGQDGPFDRAGGALEDGEEVEELDEVAQPGDSRLEVDYEHFEGVDRLPAPEPVAKPPAS